MSTTDSTTKRGRGRPELSKELKREHLSFRILPAQMRALESIGSDFDNSPRDALESILAFIDPDSEFNQSLENAEKAAVAVRFIQLLNMAKLSHHGAFVRSDEEKAEAAQMMSNQDPLNWEPSKTAASLRESRKSRKNCEHVATSEGRSTTGLRFTALPLEKIRKEFAQ